MITLTAPQEAALNAAQEVLVELSQQMQMDKATSSSLALSYYPCWSKGKEFYAHFPDPRKPNSSLDTTGAPSIVAAVVAVLAKQEEVRNEPAKLTTPREVIDAIKTLANDQSDQGGDVALADLLPAIDALPIA